MCCCSSSPYTLQMQGLQRLSKWVFQGEHWFLSSAKATCETDRYCSVKFSGITMKGTGYKSSADVFRKVDALLSWHHALRTVLVDLSPPGFLYPA